MKIGILMGGVSTEREISLKTGQKMWESLVERYPDCERIYIDSKSDILEKGKDLDFALIALHGRYGEDGQIQSILDAMDLPYSGSDTKSSAVGMDKDLTKVILRQKNIPTADWIVVQKDFDPEEALRFFRKHKKVVVKPNSGGSSVMTFIIEEEGELLTAMEQALTVDEEVMVEAFLPGMEISVPILDGQVLPTLKITAEGFFDYVAKYQDKEHGGATEEVITLEEPLQSQVNEWAMATFKALKCSVYGRVDFIISDGKPYVLEINTLPGMTSASLLPKSAASVGISYIDVLQTLVDASLKIRKNKEK